MYSNNASINIVCHGQFLGIDNLKYKMQMLMLGTKELFKCSNRAEKVGGLLLNEVQKFPIFFTSIFFCFVLVQKGGKDLFFPFDFQPKFYGFFLQSRKLCRYVCGFLRLHVYAFKKALTDNSLNLFSKSLWLHKAEVEIL